MARFGGLVCDQAAAAPADLALSREPLLSHSSFLVIGQGSIGQRHARLLAQHGKVSTVSSVAEGSFRSIAEALSASNYTHAVVANVTSHHSEAVGELVSCGFVGHLLVEKPVCSSPVEIPQLIKASRSLPSVLVGYNLRFHPVVRSLRRVLQGRKVIEARLSVGQLLSDWRPGTDHRKGSSALMSAGGGALRDLSHELDLALSLFGPWKRVVALGGNFHRLGIETDEAWSIIIEAEVGTMISISLNYFDRPGRRSICATTEVNSIVADLTAGLINVGEDQEHLVVHRDDTYEQLHMDFITEGGQSCSLAEGLAVVELIDAIEESCRQRKWIES